MNTRAALLAHLDTLAAGGHVAPCLTYPEAGWTSDDHAEQRVAASLCARCPALAPCRAYGLDDPDEYGVYGALTDPARHRTIPTTKGA